MGLRALAIRTKIMCDNVYSEIEKLMIIIIEYVLITVYALL